MSTSPAKCDQQKDRKQGDSEDIGGNNEEVLPAMGKLSLNVKAVPYIPKQDGALQSQLGNGSSEESGSEKNDSLSADNEQVRIKCFLYHSSLSS